MREEQKSDILEKMKKGSVPMRENLKDKVALVTGAGGGIGSAVANTLAEMGMKLVLLGGRNPEKLEKICSSVSRQTECLILPGDLSDISWLDGAVRQVAEHFGGVDVLVNNAGMAMSTPFEEVTPEQYDQIMQINVRTPYFLTQKVLPLLKKSGCGTVINIASVVAHAGYPLQSAYAASKHALLGFTKSLAREVYQDNVRVHAICPGGVYTDMVKVARPDLTGEGMIQPEEIAEIVRFFLEYRGNAVIDEIDVHRVNKEPFLI